MKDISWAACLRLGVTAAAVYLICAGRDMLGALSGALSPLLLGGGVACIVNIPMSAMERRLFPKGGRAGRCVCLALSMAGTLAVVGWLAGVILPELVTCAALLAGELPELLGAFWAWLDESGVAAWLQSAILPEGDALLRQGLTLALSGAGDALGRAAEMLSALTAGVANALLALILATYMLSGKERLGDQAARLTRRLLGEKALARAKTVLKALHGAFCVYVKGQCLEALLLGCLCLLGMMALGLPMALTISVLAGTAALIPLAGPMIAAAAGAALLIPCGVSEALTFVIFFLLLQQVESNLISPRIVGATLGLSPVWMLTAMLVGGGLFGMTGALLAVPAAAAVRTLLTK